MNFKTLSYLAVLAVVLSFLCSCEKEEILATKFRPIEIISSDIGLEHVAKFELKGSVPAEGGSYVIVPEELRYPPYIMTMEIDGKSERPKEVYSPSPSDMCIPAYYGDWGRIDYKFDVSPCEIILTINENMLSVPRIITLHLSGMPVGYSDIYVTQMASDTSVDQ